MTDDLTSSAVGASKRGGTSAAMELQHVKKTYQALRSSRWRSRLRLTAGAGDEHQWALNDVDLQVRPGECLGVVGQSGSGKTTLGHCMAGLLPIDAGVIRYQGAVVAESGGTVRIPRVDGVQMVYQDPYSTLNPRRSVGSVLREILSVHRLCARDERDRRCIELVEQVGLESTVLKQRPRQLSGGMCQRIAIARALAFRPTLLIADEIVSALDASVQAQVLNLVADLRDTTTVAIVFITHDLSVVNQLCDRVLVMNEGRIVEEGPTEQVLNDPKDPYTAQLIEAVPTIASLSARADPAR